MKKNLFLLILLLLIGTLSLQAQGYYFGIKGGPSLCQQRWDNYNRKPLVAYHGALFLESLGGATDSTKASSFFVELGYHQRGSSEYSPATQYQQPGGTVINVPARTYAYRFHNIGLAIGAKRNYKDDERFNYYYRFAARGEYTAAVNFADIVVNSPYYPHKSAVKQWNYGIMLGTGLEWNRSELYLPFAEIRICPDFSRQYYSPPIPNVRDPYSGELRTIPEQKVFNASVEISIGIKFLRKVEYVD